MLHPHEYPILEFDEAKTAKINPIAFAGEPLPTDKLVITFFPEVVERLRAEKTISLLMTIPGENPLDVYRFEGEDVLLVLGQVGCPACAGNLDMLNAMGARKVMFCGGGGVLDKNIAVGQLLLVEGAIRDEGFSYHYLPASRCVYTAPATVSALAKYLDANNISYLRGLTWTTDAIFRETQARIERRRAEGAKIVEMEQSGCIAVAQFRGFDYGALIYGGDDVSQDTWDQRRWRSCNGIRYDLVMLCKALTQVI